MSTPDFLFTSPPSRPRPYVHIVEQPSRSQRYRYRCEGRPSPILGASSTPDNKNPLAIQIVGYQGRVVVVVSCVSKDPPHRAHPHRLVGQNCKKGICTFETEVTADNPIITFQKLAHQCLKKNDVGEALRLREENNIDPFLMGFEHKNNIKSIDLNVVRLCFQVILINENRGRTGVLSPVVSDPIYNKKTLPDPLIHRISHCNSPANGRKEDIILLCTKVSTNDINIRFFETKNGKVVWEKLATFNPNHVYNSSAFCFKPPAYHNQNIIEPVRVNIQLERPSDGLVSPPIEFEYLPLHIEPKAIREKRKKYLDRSPLFAQLFQNSGKQEAGACQFPFDVPLVENNLMETTPWMSSQAPVLLPNLENLPLAINDINNTGSTTKNSPNYFSNWSDSNDLSIGTNVNLENASAICQVLNIKCNEIELEPIHISSGDLEMTDVNRLSGNLQEYLVIQ